MAYNDIKSTGERVSTLKSIRKQIDMCIKNCQLAQQFYGAGTGADNYGDFDQLWEGVNSRLVAADACADLAISELTLLTGTDGFVFQYEWVIGKRGVYAFTFNATSDTCVIGATNAVVINASVVVELGDFCVITGTASNNGSFAVNSGSASSTIEFTGSIADETCTTAGAKIILAQRVA